LKKISLLILVFYIFTVNIYRTEASEKPVRIAYLKNALDHLACWVAIEKGFFDKHGIKFEISVFTTGPEMMKAFVSGKLDIGYVGEAPATIAVANNEADVVTVAQVNTEGSAIVIAQQYSDIKNIAELKAKRVAIPGYSTVQDFLLRRTLIKNRVDPKSVNITVVKISEMISELEKKNIDAFIAWSPYPSQAEIMKKGRIMLTSKDMWRDHPCCVLVSDTAFLKKNPEKVKAVVQAHIEATDFIHQNKDEAIEIGSGYTEMDKEIIRHAMDIIKLTYHLAVDGELEYVRYLSELGYIRVKDPVEFTERFINQDILNGLLKK